MKAVKKEEEETEDEDPIECIGVIPASTKEGNARARSRKLRNNDVLIVRDETTLEHPGNVAYRLLINLNKVVYASSSSLKDKLQISKSIVASIRRDNGRFLEREDEPGIITSLDTVKWKDVSDRKAAEITLKALREGEQSGYHDETAGSRLPPSASAAATAPVPAETKIDRTLLIKLTPEQSAKMKYPIGCPIWYDIHLNAATLPQVVMSKKYSSLGDAKLGLVISISMDITTRNLLYEVSPAKGVGNGFKSFTGTTKEGGQGDTTLVLEDHLCYATKCPVHVQLDEKMEGDVITCCFSKNGWTDITVKKSYMVTVFLSGNQIRIFQVDEDNINFRPMELELGDSVPQKEPEQNENEPTDKVEPELEANEDGETEPNSTNASVPVFQKSSVVELELGQSVSQKESEQNENEPTDKVEPEFEAEDGEINPIDPKASENMFQKSSGEVESATTSPVQTEYVSSFITDIGYASSPKHAPAVIALKGRNSTNEDPTNEAPVALAPNAAPNTAASTHNPSHSKLSNSSSSATNRGYCLEPNRETKSSSTMKNAVDQSCPRWVPPVQNTDLMSIAFPRKRRKWGPSPLSNNEGFDTTSHERPTKCSKSDDVDETEENSSVGKTTEDSEYIRLLATLTDHGNESVASLARQNVQLPPWLVANEASCNEVIEVLDTQLQNIFEATGCIIRIHKIPHKNETQIFLSIVSCKEMPGKKMIGKDAMEMVENILLKLLGAEESRGRLLYDIARFYGNSQGKYQSYGCVKYDGAVQQRNPLCSLERVWMTVVELPNEMVHQGKPSFHPALESQFQSRTCQNNLHEARCTLLLGKDNFNAELFRCRPYVLVLGKQKKDVDQGVALIKTTLKQFTQRFDLNQISAPRSHFVEEAKHESPSHLEAATCVSWSNINPRKLMIPAWLLSDANYLKKIEDGLFGSEWCKEKKFQDCTGCELIRSHHYLLIKPSQNAPRGPGIQGATDMIEDSLLDCLGASEAKCMLLYDLAKSYNQHPLDGIVRIRNPLNSSHQVWANVIDLSHYHYSTTAPFLTREMSDEMHRLRCCLKVCQECNFGMKLDHCHPYVLVMGRQKKNVGDAVFFVKRSIQTHQQRCEMNFGSREHPTNGMSQENVGSIRPPNSSI